MLIKEIVIPGLETIKPDVSMIEVDKAMRSLNIRHLPVMENGKLIGILSNRDVQRAMTPHAGSDSTQTHIYKHKKASEFMSSPVFVMRENEEVVKMIQEMLRRKISCTVIQDENDKLIGIVTTEDLLLLLLDLMTSRLGLFARLKLAFSLVKLKGGKS